MFLSVFASFGFSRISRVFEFYNVIKYLLFTRERRRTYKCEWFFHEAGRRGRLNVQGYFESCLFHRITIDRFTGETTISNYPWKTIISVYTQAIPLTCNACQTILHYSKLFPIISVVVRVHRDSSSFLHFLFCLNIRVLDKHTGNENIFVKTSCTLWSVYTVVVLRK